MHSLAARGTEVISNVPAPLPELELEEELELELCGCAGLSACMKRRVFSGKRMLLAYPAASTLPKRWNSPGLTSTTILLINRTTGWIGSKVWVRAFRFDQFNVIPLSSDLKGHEMCVLGVPDTTTTQIGAERSNVTSEPRKSFARQVFVPSAMFRASQYRVDQPLHIVVANVYLQM